MKDHIKVLALHNRITKPKSLAKKLSAIAEATADSTLKHLIQQRLKGIERELRGHLSAADHVLNQGAIKILREYCERKRDQHLFGAREKVYDLVDDWCSQNPGTGSVLGLMHLVLSLYDGKRWSYSIPVCLWHMDETRQEWAKTIILDYFDRGENPELIALGRKFEARVEELV